MGTLPGPESAALHKPLVGVIGDSEDILGAIESCKDRVEFVRLDVIPEEPNFWSARGVSGVVICGRTWLTRFHETNPSDEPGVVLRTVQDVLRQTVRRLGTRPGDLKGGCRRTRWDSRGLQRGKGSRSRVYRPPAPYR